MGNAKSKKANAVDLSRAEYEIFNVLWKQKRATVREVHDRITESLGWAYTTTKTVMDRLVRKGLIDRSDFHGVFLYQPLISRPAGLARMVRFFSERVLEMDPAAVIPLFAEGKGLSDAEIEELRRLLAQDDAAGE